MPGCQLSFFLSLCLFLPLCLSFSWLLIIQGIDMKNSKTIFKQALLEERRELQQSNYLLQHKLAEHFRKKKADEARQDYDKTANDQDSKYVKYMGKSS